ncbi:MAG TPA: DUF4864 domain-containing protein [Chthoniobacteraceae bacterium]|jgi:hypothetical protein|nr:DUF4864 domain-containing protein [Chthoniobacteraceae bacterium]
MKAWHGMKMAIVGATFSVCAAGVFIRPMPPRRVGEQPRPAELYRVVMQELQSVRDADYVGAYRQVSLSMRERYNLDVFADKVRTERPDLTRYERVEFGGVRMNGRQASVPAYLFLSNGDIAAVTYLLVREEGSWRIDGSHVRRRWNGNYRVGGTRM